MIIQRGRMEPAFFRISVILISLTTSSWAATIAIPEATQDPPVFKCGEQNFDAPYGTIVSPNYPGNYFDNLDCKFYILAPSVSGSFALIFKDFDLENSYDYLRVSCATNSSFPVFTYTGKTIPGPLSIPWCRQAFLHFHTDSSIVRPGFRIEYHASDAACGNTLYTSSSGHLTSPNYPQNYNNGQNCYNIIWAPKPVPFNLSFSDFFTEENFDKVEISCWDNPAEATYTFTGTNHFPIHYTSCSEVRVWFSSDASYAFPGFYLNYNYPGDPSASSTTTPAPGIGCGQQNYDEPFGSIQSPNYPGNYGDNLYCNYYISPSGNDSSFVLIFKHFAVQPSYDHLHVYCPSNSSNEGRQYDGYEIPAPLSLPWCDEVLLNFHTDGSVTSTGFRIEYHASEGGCGNTLYTGSSGYLTSPNYPYTYENDQNCSNIIWAPHPVPFYLYFSYLYLEPGFDYVEISCLDNPAEATHRFTGTSHYAIQYTSCSEVRVLFTSDGSVTYGGFYLNYNYPADYSASPDTTGIVGK